MLSVGRSGQPQFKAGWNRFIFSQKHISVSFWFLVGWFFLGLNSLTELCCLAICYIIVINGLYVTFPAKHARRKSIFHTIVQSWRAVRQYKGLLCLALPSLCLTTWHLITLWHLWCLSRKAVHCILKPSKAINHSLVSLEEPAQQLFYCIRWLNQILNSN